jgi:capsid protein
VRELHPGEIRRNIGATDKLIRVPAEQMFHLRVVDRWPQSRGVPWFHAAAKRLRDMDGYTEAEIVAARMSASYMGFIKSPEVPTADDTVDGQKILEFEGGIIQHLAPGEEFQGFAPNRPNAQLDPFMRYMLREVASAVGVSYESLSRDYSQSNYSSSRLALLDDRDLWKSLQQWFIRSFREPLHREWLGLAVMAGAIASIPAEQYLTNRPKFEAVQFKPRGWGWVDPTKEVAAYKEAVLAGFTTVSDVIAATGNGADLEDVLNGRRRELDMMEELDLEFDTEFEKPEEPQAEAMLEPAPEPEPEESETDRAIRALTGLVGQLIAAHQVPPTVNVSIPAGAIQAHVTVEPTEVRIEDGAVQVSLHPAAIHMPAVEVSNVVPFPHAEPAQIEMAMPFRVLDDEPESPPEVANEPTDETAGAAA